MREFQELFALHVELACPDAEAAAEVLLGLKQCAQATETAGAGVPIYLFHRSEPLTQRLQSEYPRAVGLEYLECYLDANAFWNHARSKEFRAAYRQVTDPRYRIARSVYFIGTPPPSVTSAKVWAQLKVMELRPVDFLRLSLSAETSESELEYLSLFLRDTPAIEELRRLLNAIAQDPAWALSLAFLHPRRARELRFLGVRRGSALGSQQAHWSALLEQVNGIEGSCIAHSVGTLTPYLEEIGGCELHRVEDFAGYLLHPNAGQDRTCRPVNAEQAAVNSESQEC